MVLNQFKGFLVPAPVSAAIVLSLSPHCSEEEEVAGREKHTVGVRVCRSSRHLGGRCLCHWTLRTLSGNLLTILEPGDGGLWVATGFAPEQKPHIFLYL